MATQNNGRHRRRMLLLLIASVALLGWLVWGMVVDLSNRPVSYNVQHIQPVNSHLCPGDVLRYEIDLSVSQVPVILSIVESWCRPGDAGLCDRGSTVTYNVPVLTPRYVYTIASRTVPDTDFIRASKELELHHATTDGKTTSGYIVGPVYIRDNCDAPEGK